MLKDFTKRLETWLENTPRESTNSSLMIIYWTTRLYLNELALHVDHSPEDFKAPYQMGMIHQWDGEEIPTEILSLTVAECISCSHGLINTFLAIDADLRSLPVLSYVRVSYAAFILAKLGLSANHPESQISRVLDQSTLKAQDILDKAILRVQTVLGPSRCRVPSIFLALLFKLRQWCLHPELIEPPQSSFIDIGMQNAADKPEEPISADLRVAEQSSADESSPQTLPEVHAGADLGTSNLARTEVPVYDAQQQEGIIQPMNGNPSVYSNIAPTVPPVTGGDPTLLSFLNPCQQMDLDQNFFQLFSDATGLASIPMGFDSWSSLYNVPGNFEMPDNMPVDQSEQL